MKKRENSVLLGRDGHEDLSQQKEEEGGEGEKWLVERQIS